jgi:predicted MFS family arabinose efflux permease
MYGCLGYGGNFFITLMPDYLKAQRGLGPDTIKWLTTLPFACGVCACLVGGTLSDILIRVTGSREWNRRLVGLTGMGLAGVAMALVPMAEDVYVLGGLLCLTFFCNDLAMAPAWAAVADHGTKVSGTLGGLMNMTASFTGALGAIVTSRFLEAGQLGYPFWIFGIVYFLGVACWLRVETSRTLVGESKPGA